MENKQEEQMANDFNNSHHKDTVKVSEVFSVLKDQEQQQDDFIENKESNEIVTQSSEVVLNQKTKTGKILNVTFFMLTVCILIITLLIQGNSTGITDFHEFKQMAISQQYIFYIILAFVLIMFLDSLQSYLLIHKSTNLHRPILSYKSTAICRFYDCITPFSFGGQPFQIFYFNSRGLRSGVATGVTFAKFLFSQISFVIISFVALFVGLRYFNNDTNIVLVFSIISLIITALFILFILFLSFSKRRAPKIVISVINLLHKMRIVKDVKKTFTLTMRTVLEYQRAISFYLKSIFSTLLSFFISLAITVIKAMIPFIIYAMFAESLSSIHYVEIFCKFIICELATKFIPLPGGSGMAELSFTALFASLFKDGHLFWALLIYRIATYYSYLAQGLLVIIYDFFWGDKVNAKYKEKNKHKFKNARFNKNTTT